MIVDDAIVVLENIYRHRYEEKKSIVRACIDGTHEVGTPVLMSTLTTAAVFMPILLLQGRGRNPVRSRSFHHFRRNLPILV